MKDDLIQQMLRANKRLLAAIKAVGEDQAVNKEWSKKELLAHIAGWYEEGVDSTPKIISGEKPKSFSLSISGYNKRSVEKRKDMTVQQIENEINTLRDQFIELIRPLEEEQISNYHGTTLGKKEINLLWMINQCISHDNAHAKELEKI